MDEVRNTYVETSKLKKDRVKTLHHKDGAVIIVFKILPMILDNLSRMLIFVNMF